MNIVDSSNYTEHILDFQNLLLENIFLTKNSAPSPVITVVRQRLLE